MSINEKPVVDLIAAITYQSSIVLLSQQTTGLHGVSKLFLIIGIVVAQFLYACT
jgi:hypothetical protein